MKIAISTLILCFIIAGTAAGQTPRHDKGIFIEPKNEFMDSVKKAAEQFKKKPDKKPARRFQPDFSVIPHPDSVKEFTAWWHNHPVPQALTGTCWCFSTTSFFESEIHRLTGQEIKLSESWTVYWEYVEKARRFVQERGNSNFGEGSEADAVTRIWKKYGIVPGEACTGMLPGQTYHDHGAMFNEMEAYLNSLKASNAWNEEGAIATIRSILDHYMGAPPATVTVNGRKMTPQEYLAKVVKLNMDDYISLLSLMDKPYNQFVEHEVPDNWWHSANYYNVPLDDFMKAIKAAIRGGYTICLGGDVSEPGYEGHAGIAIVPTFDIPSDYIDESARQFRYGNGTTGDDHGIHMVGYTVKDNKDWYLIKDSGSGSRNNSHPGYYFYQEDYVKLKMLDIMVHRDALKDVITVAGK